jgi:hypothetical protein
VVAPDPNLKFAAGDGVLTMAIAVRHAISKLPLQILIAGWVTVAQFSGALPRARIC